MKPSFKKTYGQLGIPSPPSPEFLEFIKDLHALLDYHFTPEPTPACRKCNRPLVKISPFAWGYQCGCFSYSVPIRDDKTATLPDGRVINAPNP